MALSFPTACRWGENKGAIRALGGEVSRAEAERTERSVIRELVMDLERGLEACFKEMAEVRTGCG